MSAELQVGNEHWKKHDLLAWGQAVIVEVTSEPRAAALLLFRQVAHDAASLGKAAQ